MGPYLPKPITKKKTLVQKSKGVKYTASEMQGKQLNYSGWRRNMEDAQIHKVNIGQKNISIFGIFDGHGGPQIAKFVEKNFIEYLITDKDFKTQNYSRALISTFKKMDQLLKDKKSKKQLEQIREYLTQDHSYAPQKQIQTITNTVGCTANVLLVTSDKFIVANAGDSRCVLSRKKKVIELSQDNKPDNKKQKERIQKAGGRVNNGRINNGLNLSRAIGDLSYKNNEKLSQDQQLIICIPQIKQQKRGKQDDFIIMGCDGIWQKYTNQQMIDLVHKYLDQGKLNSENLVQSLLDQFLAKQTSEEKGCDNMSIILIEFPGNISYR